MVGCFLAFCPKILGCGTNLQMVLCHFYECRFSGGNTLCGEDTQTLPAAIDLAPLLEPHQCLFAGTWKKMVQLPCWLPKGQQVSHHRWIQGLSCTQATKHTSKRIHPGFKTQRRYHQKSKTGLSVAPQKGLKFLKIKQLGITIPCVTSEIVEVRHRL